MFDARSILDALVRSGGQGQPMQPGQPPQAGGLGALGEILSQLTQGAGAQQAGQSADGSPGGLQDILSRIAAQQGQPPGAPPGAGTGGGLADILAKLQQQMSSGQAAGAGGGLMDVLGQVLAQATAGVKEGAQRADEATGASGHVRDALGKATGQTPEDLFNQLKDFINNNRAAAAAAAGGLGAAVLGTQTGRALAGSAVKLGALALIGGLAYKAIQNYQQGKPLIEVGQQPAGLAEAPRGSGYEAAAVTHDAALLYIRGMIAAASADGRIDPTEQQKILGGLKQAGLDSGAEAFLANELKHPATPEELADAVKSEQEAVQLFTAARVAIDSDTGAEHEFLVELARDLRLDGDLVAHIDAAARAA
ncbi:MAG: tellurite resistance TerB family protein [Bacteroidota bacterium]